MPPGLTTSLTRTELRDSVAGTIVALFTSLPGEFIAVLAGLALSIPFAVFTASPWLGRVMTRVGLCAVPEERAPAPESLRRLDASLAVLREGRGDAPTGEAARPALAAGEVRAA